MEFLKRRLRRMYPDMDEVELKHTATGLYWWLCGYNKDARGKR